MHPPAEPKVYPDQSAAPLGQRLKYYLTPFDKRYEDLFKGNRGLNLLRDATAGLIVAMVAIPLAMGFAMASGLRPEQGIVGGAVAGLLGALYGGSKYQVYGPTAAFIPVIAGVIAAHGYSMLVIASILAGCILMLMGVLRLGKYVALVPHSIVVGFTIGIAIVIASSQLPEIFGLKLPATHDFIEKVSMSFSDLGQANIYALIIALLTFGVSKLLLKISVYIPAPVIGVGLGTTLAATVWADKGLILVKDKFGSIPSNLLTITSIEAPALTPAFLQGLCYYTVAIIFVAAIESLLCSRMADRLANNKGMPYNPNKELWGQGLVNIFVVLVNGFPHTGALARTATNIKVGAISPLAGIFKFFFKLMLASFLASTLEIVPMACIGGILMYVATGMVHLKEVSEVWQMNLLHRALMIYTAVVVVIEDFLIGVLSAIVLYGLAMAYQEWSAARKLVLTLQEVEAE